jgi:hypothetical protein
MRAASCSEAFPISADRHFLKFGGANFYAAVSILSASFGAGFPTPIPWGVDPVGRLAKPPTLLLILPVPELSGPQNPRGYILIVFGLCQLIFYFLAPKNPIVCRLTNFFIILLAHMEIRSDAHEFNRVVFDIPHAVPHRQSYRNVSPISPPFKKKLTLRPKIFAE